MSLTRRVLLKMTVAAVWCATLVKVGRAHTATPQIQSKARRILLNGREVCIDKEKPPFLTRDRGMWSRGETVQDSVSRAEPLFGAKVRWEDDGTEHPLNYKASAKVLTGRNRKEERPALESLYKKQAWSQVDDWASIQASVLADAQCLSRQEEEEK